MPPTYNIDDVRLFDSEGNLVTSLNPLPVFQTDGLITEDYDYISVAYPDGVTEIYSYKDGGVSGTLVATLTLVYTDSTKDNVLSITKS